MNEKDSLVGRFAVSVVEIDRRHCLPSVGLFALMMEAVNTGETTVSLYETAWCTVPKRTVVFILWAVRTWNLRVMHLVREKSFVS
jgi:hypothetical protein